MKITAIETFCMQAGRPPDTAWASDGGGGGGSASLRHWLFVRVRTDEGVTGIGEGSGWPKVVETAVNDLAHVLIGEDPMHVERLWQRMFIAIMSHGHTGNVGAGALNAIDMALWDIKGKALGTPVWNLLGGKMRDRVRIYGHASTPEVAVSLKERGVGAVKTGGVRNPLEKAAAIRRAVGDDVDLMVDVHGPPWMTPVDAVAVGRELRPLGLLFYEDPVAPDDLAGLRFVREKLDVPICAGERLATIWGERPLIDEGLVDVLNPDTGRVGGITQMKKVAALAEARFITLAPHSGTLGPVAEFAALHLLAAIPNCLILERIVDDWEGRASTTTVQPEYADGHLAVPDAPGLGVDIDEDFVRAHPPRHNAGLPAGGYEPGTEEECVYYQARRRRASAFRLPPAG